MATVSKISRGPMAGQVLTPILMTLLAVSTGVWLGALYVGVPVNDLAYTALDEAEILQQMPDGWRPTQPGCPTGDCEKLSPEQVNAQLQQELASLRYEALTLRKAAAGNVKAVEAVVGAAVLHSSKLRRDRTMAYWQRLCEIANGVTYLHDEVAGAADTANAGEVVDLRRRAFEYGVRAIRAIPRDSVDEQAVMSGQRFVNWYEHGADLHREAAEAWRSRGSDLNDRLDAALALQQRQHVKEARLIREQANRVSQVLSRRYVAEFATPGI